MANWSARFMGPPGLSSAPPGRGGGGAALRRPGGRFPEVVAAPRPPVPRRSGDLVPDHLLQEPDELLGPVQFEAAGPEAVEELPQPRLADIGLLEHPPQLVVHQR